MRRALILVVLLTGLAHATPSEDFDQARAAFRTGQFALAREKLNDLLYPAPKLARPEDLAEAYVTLGVCRLETGDPPGAKREFENALALDPNRQIDPFVVTDKEAIRLFDDTKTEIKVRADEEADRKRKAELRKIKDSYVGFESHSFLLNFAPFGIGQFQNRQIAKGVVFGGAEAIALGTSVTVWAYLVDKYGIRSTHVPLADGPSVRNLQQLEIGSGLAFLGIWIYSAIDAYRNYKPATRGVLDESLLPPELRELDKADAKKKAAKPKPTSLLEHIVPMVTPSGAGIGLGWEN